MKRKIFYNILLLHFTFSLCAQITLPEIGKKRVTKSPEFNVELLPDFIVRLSGITASPDHRNDSFGARTNFIRLSINATVSNIGDRNSGRGENINGVQLRAYVIPNPSGRHLTKIPAVPAVSNFGDGGSLDGVWFLLSSSDNLINNIGPGAAQIKTCTYEIDEATLRAIGTNFYFLIVADYFDSVAEKNENNNVSVPVAVRLF
jgi:hypothetical protein